MEEVHRAPQLLGDVSAKDLFPDVVSREEMNQAIKLSESRLKFWAVASITSHLVVALPVIFYMGQVAESIRQVSTSVSELQANQKVSDDWVRDRMVWEARVQAALESKGVKLP